MKKRHVKTPNSRSIRVSSASRVVRVKKVVPGVTFISFSWYTEILSTAGLRCETSD